ncbi:MAG: carboxylesterase family protein, partial [Enterocloster asparagiformis]|nr:carboxylesterase family protein [Enterocloster asparagiformis]
MNHCEVTTKYGNLQGERRGGISTFRGIPYARPPVGELRFAPPQPP